MTTVRQIVRSHCSTMKYHKNMQDKRNLFRSDLDNKWDKSQPISDEEKKYHLQKIYELTEIFRKHQHRVLMAKKQPMKIGSNKHKQMVYKEHKYRKRNEAIAHRKALIKEGEKILKSKILVWRLNKPIVVKGGWSNDTVKTLYKILNDYAEEQGLNSARQTRMIAGRSPVIKRKKV